MIDQYLDDAPRWLARVERGVQDGDADGAATAAAALAGASEALGAHDVADRAGRLEHAVRNGDPAIGSTLAITSQVLGDLRERLREQREQGWPTG